MIEMDGHTLDPDDLGCQAFRDLNPTREAVLRSTIKKFGVILPILIDQNGKIIDGKSRVRIALQEGVPFKVIQRDIRDEVEGRELSAMIGAARRPFEKAERQEVVQDLLTTTTERRGVTVGQHSPWAVAEALGVSLPTIQRDIVELTEKGVTFPEKTIGRDNKVRSMSRPPKEQPIFKEPEPEPPPVSETLARYLAPTELRKTAVASKRSGATVPEIAEVVGRSENWVKEVLAEAAAPATATKAKTAPTPKPKPDPVVPTQHEVSQMRTALLTFSGTERVKDLKALVGSFSALSWDPLDLGLREAQLSEIVSQIRDVRAHLTKLARILEGKISG